MVFRRIERRLRSWLGMGWSAQEFQQRYAAKSQDAWGYLESAAHAERSARILRAFAGWQPQRVLEVGCAEGFLTKRLLLLANQVVACDLSDLAAARAAAHCAGVGSGLFLTMDIRRKIPEGKFDTCLLSDVLYYLSPAEIRDLSGRLHRSMPKPRRLIFANEWNVSYRDLTTPEVALQCLTTSGQWSCVQTDRLDLGDGKSHVLALLE